MTEDFDHKFREIINSNNFGEVESPFDQIALHELTSCLESINETSMLIAHILFEAIHTKEDHFPAAAVKIFRALQLLSEEFNSLATEEDEDEEEGEFFEEIIIDEDEDE